MFQTNVEAGLPGLDCASADGQKFLIAAKTAEATSIPLTLVSNWTADLKK